MTNKCGGQNPQDRFSDNQNQLRELVKCSSKDGRSLLSDFGISINEKFNIIEGRILDIPHIIGGKQLSPYQPPDSKWKPEKTSGFQSKFIETNDFKWAVYNLYRIGSRRLDDKNVKLLINNLSISANQNGIILPEPIFAESSKFFENFISNLPC